MSVWPQFKKGYLRTASCNAVCWSGCRFAGAVEARCAHLVAWESCRSLVNTLTERVIGFSISWERSNTCCLISWPSVAIFKRGFTSVRPETLRSWPECPCGLSVSLDRQMEKTEREGGVCWQLRKKKDVKIRGGGRRLCGPQTGSGALEKRRNMLLLPGIELWFLPLPF